MTTKYKLEDVGDIQTVCAINYNAWNKLLNKEIPNLEPNDSDGYNIVAEEELNNYSYFQVKHIKGQYAYNKKDEDAVLGLTPGEFVSWLDAKRTWATNVSRMFRTHTILMYLVMNDILPEATYLIDISW